MGSANAFWVSFLIGGIGFVLGSYGLKMKRIPQATAGAALMVFPYFVDDLAVSGIVAAVLCLACFVAVRLGY